MCGFQIKSKNLTVRIVFVCSEVGRGPVAGRFVSISVEEMTELHIFTTVKSLRLLEPRVRDI